MDNGELKNVITAMLRKYRWAAAVLVIGLLLMALPQQNTPSQTQAPVPEETGEAQDLQQQLEALLSKLDGAGKVKVLLSPARGAQNHYQTDEQTDTAEKSSNRRVETVIITDQSRQQQGLLMRTDPPVYLGAVVLCQGADRPAVRLAVVEAVATATGLTSDKISVLKMK